jgi:hypothetical protein
MDGYPDNIELGQDLIANIFHLQFLTILIKGGTNPARNRTDTEKEWLFL